MADVVNRFLKYVSFDTQSEDGKDCVPSTQKQFKLAEYLKKELEDIGAQNVRLTEHCYVYADIPSNMDRECPSIGFIAHMDTSSAISGKDIKPRIISNYDGNTIVLNSELNCTMSPDDFPALKQLKGKDLIVTDGTTLLGADDKAGIAEIMAMAEYFIANPQVKHGNIRIAFTPDEEVGNGVDYFDVKGFGADFAYTMDGSTLGEIEYENFNASNLCIEVQGFSIHPGSAKGKMKNSIRIAMEFENMLSQFQNPEYTEGYEGFHHLGDICGNEEHTTMGYILRDHDAGRLEHMKEELSKAAEYINYKYGENTVKITETGSYQNMKEMILPHMHLITNAQKVMKELGITPVCVPIRGGTDGARLSYEGLPCPNLCTGGGNYHGKYEYACVQSMEKCVEIIIKLVENYAAGSEQLQEYSK